MDKKKIPEKYKVWIDARKRFHLSDAQIQMARELGLNPKELGKIANDKQEPWKVPLPLFIESIYLKQFGKSRPDQVRSIEQVIKAQEQKKIVRRAAKELRRNAAIQNDTLELADE